MAHQLHGGQAPEENARPARGLEARLVFKDISMTNQPPDAADLLNESQ